MSGKIISVILTVLMLGLIYLLSRTIDPVGLEIWVKSAGVFGPIVLILLTILTGVIAPISGAPVNYAGFILYGPKVVFLFAVSGTIDAALNFYIARRWGRPLVKRFVGQKDMATVDKFVSEHGLVSLFFTRVFLGSLGDFISYAMGLTNVKFTPYFIVTVLASIPGTLLVYWIGLRSSSPLAYLVATTVLAIVFTGVFGLYSFVMKMVKKRA